MEILFRKMEISDIDSVHSLEIECFKNPWGAKTFIKELTENKLARYFVIEKDSNIIAYGGMWFIVDEAHITNIGVKTAYRGHGYGEVITTNLIKYARDNGMKKITLEVRKSNFMAISLYKKLGFQSVGIRPKYYENKEDALIMWKDLV